MAEGVGDPDLRLDPVKLGKRTQELWLQHAKEAKDAELLTDMKDTILARLTIQFMEAEPGTNRVMAETRALASKDYETYLAGKAEARYLANQTKAKINGLDVYCRLGQTVDASRRAMMQRGVYPS